MRWFETAAFTLVIGGQFLAAIFLMTKRHSLYGDTNQDLARDETVLPARLDHQTGESGRGRLSARSSKSSREVEHDETLSQGAANGG